ncbi:putative amino acid transporter, transmembrane domain-containing protein [Helianthus annuus]|nr:putative amino acid transporter, transmembrane domain-containing protein [Helianthus annuus]KAJ0750328.1 putative amino acid transporter, transmembrane domain-containing protein [Helianthus annuus]
MLLFGVVQILMSQMLDFHSMVLASVVAAIMSFCYFSIGLGLGSAQVIENGKIAGSITGYPAVSVAHKLWLTFQALGDIAFACPYELILLEIQAHQLRFSPSNGSGAFPARFSDSGEILAKFCTFRLTSGGERSRCILVDKFCDVADCRRLELQDTVKSPPAENKVTKHASAIAILATSFFYLGCGCLGYAAFGNDTPGNLLTGFGFYKPYWHVAFANACLFSQPVFAFVERWLVQKLHSSQFLKRFHEIVGVLGALNLCPLAIYFPVEMYIVQRKLEAWSRKWVVLEIFSGVLMVVSAVALVGSVAGLIEAKLM